MERREILMDRLSLYINEMVGNDIRKAVKSKDISKIVDIMIDMDDDEKQEILQMVDKKTRQELEKMIEGGLI
jgi:Mg/Co/Ni transporter MgtE